MIDRGRNQGAIDNDTAKANYVKAAGQGAC